MRKSIYGIILENTKQGLVDGKRVCEIIDPTSDGRVKIGLGFLDILIHDEEVKRDHTEKVLKVIEKVFLGQLDADETETELIRIGFKTSNIMDLVIAKLNSKNYNIKVYSIFKELIYSTKDIEICKCALEITAITNLCEELVDDYILFGQVENFANSISFIMRVWKENDKFIEGIFKLLDYSESWSALNYAISLMQIESVMNDIESQKRILIYALNKKPLTMEICTDLGFQLDILSIIEDAKNNRELSYYLNILFESLLLEADPCGGIMVMPKVREYFEKYINFLKDTKYFDIKFFGFKNLNSCVIGNEDNLIKSCKEEMLEENLEDIIEIIEKEWKNINTIDNFEEVIICGSDYMYSYIEHALDNEISKEVMIYFEDMYLNEQMDTNHKNYLEKLLVKKGSNKIRKKLYFMLSDIIRKRNKIEHEYSDINIFDKDEESRRILNKIDSIIYNLKIGSIELLKKLINDYNPIVRNKALSCVEKVYNTDKTYIDEGIIKLVKSKIDDKSTSVSERAKEIYEKIKI